MTTGPAKATADRRWVATALSRVGATHRHRGIQCQDHSSAAVVGNTGRWTTEGEGDWAYVAVADGHGSAPHFRSHAGAELAVDAMERAFRSFHRQLLDGDVGPGSLQEGTGPVPADRLLIDHWATSAARFVVSQWRVLVYEHLLSYPPSDPDAEPGLARMLDHVRGRYGKTAESRMLEQIAAFHAQAATDDSEGSPSPLPLPTDPRWDLNKLGSWHAPAYGTTLLGALVGPSALYWFRLGDGAMIQLVDGQPCELSPPPPGALANETPSLSDDDADNEAEVRAVPLLDGQAPEAVILASDGVPNSYTEPGGFLAFCSELAQRASTDRSTVTGRLPAWLDLLSQGGSGDDLSVAMTWNAEGGVSTGHGVRTEDEIGTTDDDMGVGHEDQESDRC